MFRNISALTPNPCKCAIYPVVFIVDMTDLQKPKVSNCIDLNVIWYNCHRALMKSKKQTAGRPAAPVYQIRLRPAVSLSRVRQHKNIKTSGHLRVNYRQ